MSHIYFQQHSVSFLIFHWEESVRLHTFADLQQPLLCLLEHHVEAARGDHEDHHHHPHGDDEWGGGRDGWPWQALARVDPVIGEASAALFPLLRSALALAPLRVPHLGGGQVRLSAL